MKATHVANAHVRLLLVAFMAILPAPIATPAPPPCKSAGAMSVATPQEVTEFFRSQHVRVVTFLGYSGSGYEDPAAMLREARAVMLKLPHESTYINSGATGEGIGAVYAEARRLGFKTSGIVSTQAQADNVPLSTCVDHVFYIEDETWGGYLPDGKLSPTSEAMVTASDELIAIGGGDIARDELLEAQRRGKAVVFIPADMNHRAARDKAARKGQPAPTDFRGSAHEAWSRAASAR